MDAAPTFCEACRRAELSPGRRFLEEARRRIFGEPSPPFIVSMARAMSMMIGSAESRRELTAYERHRKLYVETGDPMEYTRMLRHVEEA